MTLKIEIKSDVLTPREITPKTGANAGKPMTFHEQEAYVAMIGADGKLRPYPQRIVLNIDVAKGQKAYPPGFYTINDASFYINRFNSLELGKLQLDPIQMQRAA